MVVHRERVGPGGRQIFCFVDGHLWPAAAKVIDTVLALGRLSGGESPMCPGCASAGCVPIRRMSGTAEFASSAGGSRVASPGPPSTGLADPRQNAIERYSDTSWSSPVAPAVTRGCRAY